LVRDARQSGKTLRYTFAVVALASAVASCSTTSSPLIVDALTIDKQSLADSSSQSASGADTLQLAANGDTESSNDSQSRQDRLSASADLNSASAGNEAGATDGAKTQDAEATVASADGTESASASDTAAKKERLNSGDGAETLATDETAPSKKSGFFASLFNNKPSKASLATAYVETDSGLLQAREDLKPAATNSAPSIHRIEIPTVRSASLGSDDALPGVRQVNLFEIDHRNSIEDIDTIDAEERDSPVRLASAAGMARMSPQGFIRQRDDVDVSCLKPALVQILKKVERRYGEHVMVTSGYRSREHNRRVHGAKNSMHMYCAAADIKVSGISKWELAKFLRSMPGRGGVGTYCHTNSVHVDVGPERDWNWRCRRRRG
jgi:uncharacterized protein YcbK (DUF882 family)